MYTFNITDPNEGLRTVLNALKKEGIESASRNGPVLRFPRPVTLCYLNPRQRLLTSPVRDANHVFHLFETMWMFGGMCELKPLLTYNAGMAQYSDDGDNLRGTAYGHRWRNYYPQWGDQILKVYNLLRYNPDDRRAVMTMWDPAELGAKGKDFACNLQVIFSTRPPTEPGGKHTLDMVVTNRSNDLIYGAMGSNMFHFSMLLEYMAQLCAMEVGVYYQVATNLHLYTENAAAARCLAKAEHLRADEVSSQPDYTLTQLGLTPDKTVIREYIENTDSPTSEPYLQGVVVPLVQAYRVFKLNSTHGASLPTRNRLEAAQKLAEACASTPLARATVMWLQKRLDKEKAGD